MKQESLFASHGALHKLTLDDIKELYSESNSLGRFSEDTVDGFLDMIWDGPTEGEVYPVEGLGKFTCLGNWGVAQDERKQGFAMRHEESGLVFMFEGIYSSWDSTEYEISEAEQVEVRMLRWVPKS